MRVNRRSFVDTFTVRQCLSMNIHINGETKSLREGLTISELLQELDIRTEQVAVELNLKILDRTEFSTSVLQDGDSVEILSFMGGGTMTPP